MPILVTPAFSKAIKKLHAADKLAIDKAVRAIADNPGIGEEKKGDLAGIFVYKFKVNKQEVLLAYRPHPTNFSPESLFLLSIGSHENFYTQLKRLH